MLFFLEEKNGMRYYRIADFSIGLETTNNSVISRFEPFAVDKPENLDLAIDLVPKRDIDVPGGDMLSNEKKLVWIKKSDGGYFSYLENPYGTPCVAVDSDAEWEKCTIYYQDNIVSSNPDINPSDILALQFIGMTFRSHIVYKNSIVLHASCIEYEGKGIAFTAPSGTGKSTHARLWEENKTGTRVINDDAPIIRLIDGKPFAYGSPWSGSTDKFLNINAPLTAIVLLEQATVNSIRPLSIQEAVTLIMPRVLLPYHDSKMMEMAVSTFEKVISAVPAYKLKCRPDAEAVETVYQCIM